MPIQDGGFHWAEMIFSRTLFYANVSTNALHLFMVNALPTTVCEILDKHFRMSKFITYALLYIPEGDFRLEFRCFCSLRPIPAGFPLFRLIRKSLQSKMTALNFFVHGLAQVKQASSGGGVSGTGSGSPNVQGASPRNSLPRAESRDKDVTPDPISPGITAGAGRAAPLNNSTGQLLSFNPKRFR